MQRAASGRRDPCALRIDCHSLKDRQNATASRKERPMNLGKLGVWAGLDGMTAADAQAFARRLEKRGYTTLWTPESRGRNALVNAAWLLAGTSSLVVAT